MSDPHLWPLNPNSPTPAPQIDWLSIPVTTMEEVKLPTIRRVPRKCLIELKSKYGHLWNSLPAECQEAACAIIEGRPEVKEKKAASKKKPTSRKEEILQELEDIIQDAEATGDIGARLKGLEVKAKIESLLNVKPETADPVVNIHIVTGVNRG